MDSRKLSDAAAVRMVRASARTIEDEMREREVVGHVVARRGARLAVDGVVDGAGLGGERAEPADEAVEARGDGAGRLGEEQVDGAAAREGTPVVR